MAGRLTHIPSAALSCSTRPSPTIRGQKIHVSVFHTIGLMMGFRRMYACTRSWSARSTHLATGSPTFYPVNFTYLPALSCQAHRPCTYAPYDTTTHTSIRKLPLPFRIWCRQSATPSIGRCFRRLPPPMSCAGKGQTSVFK